MAKKKKRRIQAPSLSPLDKGIYNCLIVLSVVGGMCLYPAIIGSFRRSVFADGHILAQNNPGAVMLVFLGLCIGGGFAVVFDWLRRTKQPIFGKADVQYGPPQWKPVYPLLSKKFWINPYTKKRYMVIGILCVLVLTVVLATLFGLPPRECLYDDGGILVYNCLNQETAKYNQWDVAEIRIYTDIEHRWRRLDDWGIKMKVSMKDGKEFYFSYRDFRTLDENVHGSLTGMHKIKSLFDPSMIIIDGKEALSRVVWDMNLDRQETELLYRLFDAEEP